MIKAMCKTYSRCGKTCDERFNSAKDDRAIMLLGEKLTSKSPESIHFEKKDNGELAEVMRNIQTHRERISTASTKNSSTVFQVQGRDEYYKSVKNHDKVPPCGYYNLENQQLKKCKSIPNFSKKHKSKSRVPKVKVDIPLRLVDKPSNRVHSVYNWRLQLDRPSLEKMGKDVNEKRFESTLPEPAISSKTRKITSPNMDLTTGHNLALPVTQNSTIYNPSFKFIWKDLSRPLLSFDKYPARKPNMFHITDLDYQRKSYKQTDRAVPSVYFDRNTSRPVSNNLPSFMVVRDM